MGTVMPGAVARQHASEVALMAGALQVVFAAIAPGKVVANLVAGAVAEAGAQQAGDMMQVRTSLTCNIVNYLFCSLFWLASLPLMLQRLAGFGTKAPAR